MKSRDFLVGLTFFGLLAMLGASTIFLADFSFGPKHELAVPFTDVGGLSQGAEVRIDGLLSGRVRGLVRRPGEKGIFVTLSFDREPALPDNATFAITSASALGGRVVEIWTNRASGTGLLAEDGRTWRGPGPNAMDALSNLVRDNEKQIQRTIANIEAFTADLNPADRDRETLVMAVREAVENLKGISAGLKGGKGLLGRLLTEEALADNVESAVANIEKVSGELANGQGVFAKLVSDRELAQKVDSVITNIEELTAGVKQGEGLVGMLLTDREMKGTLHRTLLSLESVSRKLDRGDSLLAGILGDDTVAQVLVDAFAKLDSAATRIDTATASLSQKNSIIGMLLTDSEAAKEVRNSIKSLSDFIETTRENAPITTFAGILLSPF